MTEETVAQTVETVAVEAAPIVQEHVGEQITGVVAETVVDESGAVVVEAGEEVVIDKADIVEETVPGGEAA